MKILIVTSQLAEPIVKKYTKKSKFNLSVVALPFGVAALMTSRYISLKLSGINTENFEMILIPGLVKGNISIITKTTGIPTFKGPRHAADIPAVLDNLPNIELSTTIPACDIIREELNRKSLEILKETETNKKALLKKDGNIQVGNLAVGKDFPSRIVAEIVDAPMMTDTEIKEKAVYYANSGADIIDVGMVAGLSMPRDASRAIDAVKEVVDIPVSIDSMDPIEIEEAVSAKADLIVSLDPKNIVEVSKFGTHLPAVVLPTDFRKGLFPRKASERLKLLEENIKTSRENGFTKIIADPILDPLVTPGSTESIVATYKFRERYPNIPIFLGVGNVTELLDADSPGVNAFLAGIAAEMEVSFLLTTEVSDKARGSVRELAKVSDMMFLAKKRESIPKEIGLNLLILKEEKLKSEEYNKSILKETEIIDAEIKDEYRLDPKGCFKILLERDKDSILLFHYIRSNMKQPELIIRGKTPKEVYMAASEKGLMSTLEHAAYLGSEVEKAFIALKLERSYIQDTPLF